ncbi:MAG: spoIIIJ-associated protein [Acidobacteriota bacterium]|jgi:predicted RNA-binding protein Jag|nr:spoIIIJ-associated protein [Acidobacteriota bacterium]
MSQRFEGRNLEEALQDATSTLGVERWQLTYHVLLEKRGFLGGMKRVVIEADVNVEGPAPAAPPPAPAPAPVAAAPREARAPQAQPPAPAARNPRTERQPRGGGGEGGGGRAGGGAPRESAPRESGGAPREGGRGGRGGRGRGRGGNNGGGGRRSPGAELQTGDFEKFFVDAPEQGSESAQAKLVHDWIDEVISLSRLEVVARTEENETQILVRLYGGDSKRLVERHGEVLDAIQVLANKALVGRKVEKEIELDTESFKEQRTDELSVKAREAADRVRRDRKEELLPAMSPIERRIVHIALRDDADVTTDSRGEGFFKRVAIVLRSEATPTASEPTES